MLNHISPEKIIFLDIETIPVQADFKDLPENLKPFWEKKAKTLAYNSSGQEEQAMSPSESFAQYAGLFAEFGKIICISVGNISFANGEKVFRLKSFAGDDETQLLKDFAEILHALKNKPGHQLCGHNIKEFDLPFVARKMIIHGLPLPEQIDVAGKKPWEVPYIDTMELWKFGSFRHQISLALMATLLGIPTPKDDIDGSQVAQVYYQERNIKRIATYCEKDVLTTAQVFLKLKGEPLINPEHVIHITD